MRHETSTTIERCSNHAWGTFGLLFGAHFGETFEPFVGSSFGSRFGLMFWKTERENLGAQAARSLAQIAAMAAAMKTMKAMKKKALSESDEAPINTTDASL